jgi:predicted RecB family endonuclease
LSAIANELGVEVCNLFQEVETSTDNRNMLERFKKDIIQNVLETLEAVTGRMRNRSGAVAPVSAGGIICVYQYHCIYQY